MGSFLIDDMMMKRGLRLGGCELLLFALIFSYSRYGLPLYESEISLSNRLPYTRRQIGRSLQVLCSKGLIKRSDHKHPGCQSYEYTVDNEGVRQNAPSLCDKMSHQDVTNSPTNIGNNVSATGDKMSHNNNTADKNNKERDNDLRAPFNYYILNNRWDMLLQQPKWMNKSNEQLQLAIDTIKSEAVPIAMEMLKYTISHSYIDIYPPKSQIREDGEALEAKYLEDERRLRQSQIVGMMSALQASAPDELKQLMPDVKQCVMQFGTLELTCPAPIAKWIDENLEITKPIIRSYFPGFKLQFTVPKT